MGGATTLSAPEDQVMGLMKQVADEAGLDIQAAMPDAVASTVGGKSAERAAEDDALTRRLAALRE